MTKNCERRVVILDTSALVAGLDPFSIGEEQFTVPLVRDEVSGHSLVGFRFKTALESGRVRVEAPAKEFIKSAKSSATFVGDEFFLSETDLQVLALALELKSEGRSPIIATDDYSIQNVSNQMGIEFAPLITFGIRRRLYWVRYCPACHRTYSTNYEATECKVCGTHLKRKSLKKTADF